MRNIFVLFSVFVSLHCFSQIDKINSHIYNLMHYDYYLYSKNYILHFPDTNKNLSFNIKFKGDSLSESDSVFVRYDQLGRLIYYKDDRYTFTNDYGSLVNISKNKDRSFKSNEPQSEVKSYIYHTLERIDSVISVVNDSSKSLSLFTYTAFANGTLVEVKLDGKIFKSNYFFYDEKNKFFQWEILTNGNSSWLLYKKQFNYRFYFSGEMIFCVNPRPKKTSKYIDEKGRTIITEVYDFWDTCQTSMVGEITVIRTPN